MGNGFEIVKTAISPAVIQVEKMVYFLEIIAILLF